ncbi:MAG: hypothetical protein KJP07_13555 [Desulfatitalea sp.]|nr:hypothetical protein [Desulfatitalea sp.]
MTQGLSGLQDTLVQQRDIRAKEEEKKTKQARLEQMRTGAAEAFKTGDPMKMAEFSIQYPEMSTAMSNVIKMQSGLDEEEAAIQEKEYFNAMYLWKQNPTEENAMEIIEERKDLNLPGSDQFLGILSQDPDKAMNMVDSELAMRDSKNWKAFQESQAGPGGVEPTAEMQTFDYLTSGLSEGEKARAKRVKLGLSPRASEDAVSKAMKAMAVETAKLQARLGLEPQVAGAVAAAKNQAKIEADESVDRKSKETAWEVYNSSMSNLASAMEGATTGPFMGYIPTITANAQIAEGAQAVMAPVLKQMFRSAGEGIFTDKDQELLMKMVPTRDDLTDARVAKIKAIDDVVRAKLGKTASSEGVKKGEQPQYKEGQTATGPGGKKMIFKNGNWEAM